MSNYFTRPRGLHPTPSTCYPPPPPPGGGRIVGSVWLGDQVMVTTGSYAIYWDVKAVLLPIGDPIDIQFNLPHIFVSPPVAPGNGVPGTQTIYPDGTVGTFSGNVRVRWSSGQIRTYPLIYKLIP